MKTKLIALMLLAGGALFAETHFSIGVQIGRPGPVVVQAYRPACPGPGYVWIDPYYGPYGHYYAGYWALPPYAGAYWVRPRFVNRHFFAGYWAGPRFAPRGHAYGYWRNHDRWDRDDRGFRGRGRDRDHDRRW